MAEEASKEEVTNAANKQDEVEETEQPGDKTATSPTSPRVSSPFHTNLNELADENEPQAEANPSLECNYFEVLAVAQVADTLLRGLASASMAQAAGTPFRDATKVAADIIRDLLPFLDQESAAYRDRQQEELAKQGLEPATFGDGELQHTLRLVHELLDRFTKRKRSFLGRVFSGGADSKDEKLEHLVMDMERSAIWSIGHREALAKELIRRMDLACVEHCGKSFSTVDDLHEHKANCPLRPVTCDNNGCVEVCCARALSKHDSECPYKELPCEQGCPETIPRMDMNKHCLTTCPMKVVRCPFQEAGCNLETVVQGSVDKHCNENVAHHLALLNLYTREQQLVIDKHSELFNNFTKQLAMVSGNAESDLKTLSNQVKDLTAKVQVLEKENSTFRKELSKSSRSAFSEVALVREELKSLKDALRTR
eukprot:jgi/Chlat1/179/Chrsp1S03105